MAFDIAKCVALHVPNMDDAEAYYQRVLGYETRFRASDFVQMDAGHMSVVLTERQDIVDPLLEIRTEDVARMEDRLVGQGFVRCRPAHRPHERYVKDPFGHMYCLVETI